MAVTIGLAVLAGSGCGHVNRRFVIESNVPNAQVYVNNQRIGTAPAHLSFEYYGYYDIEVVHPDFQREKRHVHVATPWYAYPPFDFLAEIAWPFGIEDVRRYNFTLHPAVRTDTGELVNKAEDLRQRGVNLPPPAHPAEKKPKKAPEELPPGAPPVEEPGGVVPPVDRPPGEGPAPEAPGGVVPGVMP
ncbi:MAG TPA: PEGA domain-containing protein [Urbifossiella sp.]